MLWNQPGLLLLDLDGKYRLKLVGGRNKLAFLLKQDLSIEKVKVIPKVNGNLQIHVNGLQTEAVKRANGISE